jgi:hypothetical protein
VYRDFELKSGHRLDTQLLGYVSLAELVLHGTQLGINLVEEPEGSGRLRVLRDKQQQQQQQSMNPLDGYAGELSGVLGGCGTCCFVWG